jgi:hypothetical protein
MKKIFISVLFLTVSTVFYAQKINISYSFANVEAGYDHKTRCILYLDGVEMMTSPSTMESKSGKFTANVPKGKHKIKIVNFAYYNNKWEPHLISNDYSQDCSFDAEIEFKSKKTKLNLDLLFDLNAGTTFKMSGKKFEMVD